MKGTFFRYTVVLCGLISQVSLSQTVRTFSYDVGQLPRFWITPVMLFNNIYPDTTLFSQQPAQEVVLARDEAFIVQLTNCSIQDQWTQAIEDSAMKLIQSDTTVTDSTISLSFSYSSSKTCKGCMVFHNAASHNGRELIIEYTCDPVDTLVFDLTRQDWLVDTTSPASVLLLHLSGHTNASKLKVENYGDGIRSAIALFPQNDGSFSDTVAIAFSYDPMHQHVPKCNTRIAFYGAIGFPKVSTLLYSNPTWVNQKDDGPPPNKFDLCQNYPNPFNPSTTITYVVPALTQVRLVVYDILGRQISVLVDQIQSPGKRSVVFNSIGLPSGVYFYALNVGQNRRTKKMLFLQ